MDLREALEEATEFTSTLSSPESFVLVLAELLSDGFEVQYEIAKHSARFCFYPTVCAQEIMFAYGNPPGEIQGLLPESPKE